MAAITIQREQIPLDSDQKRRLKEVFVSLGIMFPVGELRFSVVSGGIGGVVKEERIK
jgi:hypothetical protein